MALIRLKEVSFNIFKYNLGVFYEALKILFYGNSFYQYLVHFVFLGGALGALWGPPLGPQKLGGPSTFNPLLPDLLVVK